MKILVIGATGLIGNAVTELLNQRGHNVVTASRSGSDVDVDVTKPDSIAAMYKTVKTIDAVVVAAGPVVAKHFSELSYEDFQASFAGKALSQIEVVRQGIDYITDGGSFSLVTGIKTRVPIKHSAAAAAANGAVEAFVMATAPEMPRGTRLNVISPTVLTEAAEKYDAAFPGFNPVPAAIVAGAFVRSIEGIETGQVIIVGE